MNDDVFPAAALPANRAGTLTAAQRAALGEQARASSRNGLQAGAALIGFGALLLFGAIGGRIATGRFGAFALGALLVAGGAWLLRKRGLTLTGEASERAAAGTGGVDAVAGAIRKHAGDNDGSVAGVLLSSDTRSRRNPRHYLFIGERRLEVNRAQYDAAPAEGRVVAYLLAGTNHLVNLERTGS